MRHDMMFTSESVTEGHPDKLCDQISDAIVDQFLLQDPHSRVRAECAVSRAIVFIAARFACSGIVDLAYVARKVIKQVGYEEPDFNANSCSILTIPQELPCDKLSFFEEGQLTNEEIESIPVKNQVTVFGYACDQTETFMPLPIWLAHKLTRQIDTIRHQGKLSYLMPDAKVQVGVEYKKGKPARIYSVTIEASQRTGKPDLKTLHDDLVKTVVRPVFGDQKIAPDKKTGIFVNPDGPVIPGGPSYHSGLTGRKNAVDTYGEYSRHSGKALSGKDPFRIDRVGAYAARYAAKNVVAAGLAKECEVSLSYAIGLSRPVSVQVETFGTGAPADQEIAGVLRETCDFRLAAILKEFNLRHLPAMNRTGFYQKLAAYGHVGRSDLDLPWERTDKAAVLGSSLK